MDIEDFIALVLVLLYFAAVAILSIATTAIATVYLYRLGVWLLPQVGLS